MAGSKTAASAAAVRSERNGAVTTVILSRPAQRNAVDGPTARALADAFRAFDADSDAAVAVLWGEGGHFCAGADLKAIAEDRGNRVAAQGDGPMGPTRMLLSKPVIAAVAGYAVAGGLELALWCDLRVVEETATFGVFCRRWGVPLVDGGTVRLPRLIGHGRALDLILTGRPVDAQEAARIGLADRVVPPGEARVAAEALAAEIAAFPQTCLRADRRSAIGQWGRDLDDALGDETRGGIAVIDSGETRAGATRFAGGAGRHGAFGSSTTGPGLGSASVEKRIRIGDIEIAYEEHGRGGRPFVLVHGYSGCRQDFDPVTADLAKLGRTLVPDLRGHGGSSRPEDPGTYSYATLVDDLRGFLDALEIDRCDLLGHSMGGMMVLRFVLAHPERVSSLVLMNTTPRALEGVERESFSKAWQIAREAGMETLQRILHARLVDDPDRAPSDRRIEAEWGERFLAHHRHRFLSMDPEAYACLGPAMYDEKPVTDRLGEIRCPTLVMVGAEDRGFLAAADLLEQGIPGAQRVTIPDADHHPQRENREAWLAAIRTHLARARGGAGA